MDFETAKTVAAFGGLGLGLLNVGVSIYKDFFRQGKLIVIVEKSDIKWRGQGDYDFLISISIRATGKDVYLKDMWIEHPTKVFGPSSTSSKLHINKVINHLLKNPLEKNADDYETEVKELFKNCEYVRDYCVKEGQQKTLTITDRFFSERLMDGWLEVPLTRWKLIVNYRTRTISMPFKFNNIKPSENHAYCERGA